MEEIKTRKTWFLSFVAVGLIGATSEKVAYASAPDAGIPTMVLASNSFVFNPRTHSWKAIQNGKVVRSGRASGGKGYCKDIGRSCRTPSGTYRVISKGGPECKSSRYPVGEGGAEMPYCMFFSKNYAIHGSYDVPNHNASHGCIRVRPHDARWLNHNFLKIGSPVIIKSY